MGNVILLTMQLACELLVFVREIVKLICESGSSGKRLRRKLARRKH